MTILCQPHNITRHLFIIKSFSGRIWDSKCSEIPDGLLGRHIAHALCWSFNVFIDGPRRMVVSTARCGSHYALECIKEICKHFVTDIVFMVVIACSLGTSSFLHRLHDLLSAWSAVASRWHNQSLQKETEKQVLHPVNGRRQTHTYIYPAHALVWHLDLQRVVLPPPPSPPQKTGSSFPQ